jgi:hypothetical protein
MKLWVQTPVSPPKKYLKQYKCYANRCYIMFSQLQDKTICKFIFSYNFDSQLVESMDIETTDLED